MTVKSIKDATRALQAQFSAARIPLSLPTESRRMLQNFIDEHDGQFSEEESSRANLELRYFWERYVGEHPSKTGAFVGVLRELRPAISHHVDIMEWWWQVVNQVITGTGYRKPAVEDAAEFLVSCMVYDEDDDRGVERAKTSNRLLSELLNIYLTRTRTLSDEDRLVVPDNAQVAQQVESVLITFGKKQPEELFRSLDDLISTANTRLQGLTLLNTFLRQQTPHLYLVINTPLIEHLLKCLMNDTSATVLSVALTSLIMLLPHIPGSLPPHLPRLFLVYSRLLCWEKFSPLSSESQRSLVTDDRLSTASEHDHGDVGTDHSWEKARPEEGAIESGTPELMTYFTYLYGLYPLNFLSYIRKPRRFLKQANFQGAEDFDLDQAVIRSRTEQFRQVHLMHANIYHLTAEEELIDPKWPKADPADVVADCHALCLISKLALVSPGPPPSSKLPEVPQFPALANMRNSPQISPSTSHASFLTGNSWRDTQSTAVSAHVGDGDSPILPLQSDDEVSIPALQARSKMTNRTSPSIDDFPQPGMLGSLRLANNKDESSPQTNLAYLQRENTLLRNELNFERWHKAQYSAHIGQLMRKNVKDATVEAEMLNLLNANRALKLQLDQVRSARDATIKDSALTRKQANKIEANLTEKFTQMRREQETWRADAEELKRLRAEATQYRELLVAIESRELNKTHQLELVKRDLEGMEDLQKKLDTAERKLREYDYREFEMQQAKRELEIVYHEKDSLQMRVQRNQHDAERTRRAFADKIAELEAQLESQEPMGRRTITAAPAPDTQILVQQAVAEGQTKLNQLRKKHTALMEKYTDLEMEYESVKRQLDAMQGARGGNGHSFLHSDLDEAYSLTDSDRVMSGALSPRNGMYDTMSDVTSMSENAFISSASDPSNRRYQPPIAAMPVSPPSSEAALQTGPGLKWKPPESRQDSLASKSSGQPAITYNQTAPLREEEIVHSSTKSAISQNSDGSRLNKKKIQPDSQVRVFGRGGAQNIKMKSKDKDKAAEGDTKAEKKGGFRAGLKNFV